MKKKIALMASTVFWVIFSIAYIAWDLWTDFQKDQLSVAYSQGYQQAVNDTVNQAMTQAENEKCEPFTIYNKEKKVDVINTKCLAQQSTGIDTQKK